MFSFRLTAVTPTGCRVVFCSLQHVPFKRLPACVERRAPRGRLASSSAGGHAEAPEDIRIQSSPAHRSPGLWLWENPLDITEQELKEDDQNLTDGQIELDSSNSPNRLAHIKLPATLHRRMRENGKKDLSTTHPRNYQKDENSARREDSNGSIESSSVGKEQFRIGLRKPSSAQGQEWQPSLPMRLRRPISIRATFSAYLDLIHFPSHHELNVSRQLDSQTEAALRTVFSLSRVKFLLRRGYTIEDIVSWAWIATAKDANTALKRLMLLASPRSPIHQMVPTFLVLQIMRAEEGQINPSNLKSLLEHLKTRIPQISDKQTRKNIYYLIWDLDIAMMLLVRSLRHARKVAPETIPDIASLACELLHDRSSLKHPNSHKASSRLAFAFNRMLSLLSLPASTNPYRTVQYLQQAQFTLLRAMLKFKPQLPVSREGYRGLISTQLAHRKTEPEIAWARVKKASWPPWRENKLGIDEDREYPGSQSRALAVLARLVEAGYSRTSLDEAAKVLAGWDTDNSPTIQQRSLLGRGPSFWWKPSLTPDDGANADAQPSERLWGARIEATRTIREAWSCFCACESERTVATKDKYEVYRAMFRKLLGPKALVDGKALPGDGREIYPEPISPQEYLYLSTDPPSVEGLYTKMLANGMKPAGRLLADLLDGCKSIDEGIRYVKESTSGEVKIDVLLHAEKYPRDFIKSTLAELPDYLFAAFVRMLLNAKSTSEKSPFCRPACISEESERPERHPCAPASYAIQMLAISKTKYVPAWRAFFIRLKRRATPSQDRSAPAHLREVRTCWRNLVNLIEDMEAAEVPGDFGILNDTMHVVHETMLCFPKEYTTNALILAKTLFAKATMPVSKSAKRWLDHEDHSSSNLFSPPDPGMLWHLTRILGIAQDLEGMMQLLRYISHFQTPLAAVRREVANGMQMMESTYILMRIFLEGKCADEDAGQPEGESVAKVATEDELREARELMEKTDTGWVDDACLEEHMNSRSKWIARVRKAWKYQLQGRGP